MAKDVKYNTEARDGLKRGVDALANAVKVTMGEKGRNVSILTGSGKIITTKDGVTVAEEFELSDPLENMGAQMVKEVASKTNELAGDGTTTATVLAQAIVQEGVKNVTSGSNPIYLKRGIDIAVKAIVEHLELTSKKVEGMIKEVATISANNDEVIGDLIADAFKKAGKDGVVNLEESESTGTYIDVVKGMTLDRGYLSAAFTNKKNEVVFENPYILLLNESISDVEAISPLFDSILAQTRPLLIIADEVSPELLSIIIYNKQKSGLNVAIIKSPGYGDDRAEQMEDLACLTGGVVINSDAGKPLEDLETEMLGGAKKVIITKDTTIISEGEGDVKARVKEIKSKIKLSKDSYEKGQLEMRLAKLNGAVATIYVGATSDLEAGEVKDRVQDALSATKAAIAEGIVAGGGVALLKARKILIGLDTGNVDQNTGVKIIYKALEAPLKTILTNAGLEVGYIVGKIDENPEGFGYNTKTDQYVDMLKAGIIDPKKVTRVALENAASVAGMILTTECVLIEKEDYRASNLSEVKPPSFF